MAGDDPNNDRNAFIIAEKKAIYAVILIILVLVAYVIIDNIQSPSLPIPQTAPMKAEIRGESESTTREVPVGFFVGGRITQMFVSEHAQVKQGDVLASIDRAPFVEALASARAKRQIAIVAYNQPIHLSTNAFNAIEASRSAVETAQYAYNNAHDDLEKHRNRLVAGQLDNVYNDDVQNEYDAKLNLEKTHRVLARQEYIAAHDPDRDADQSAMRATQEDISIAESNLVDTQLLAPTNGVIVSRLSEIGDTVFSGKAIYILSVAK